MCSMLGYDPSRWDSSLASAAWMCSLDRAERHFERVRWSLNDEGSVVTNLLQDRSRQSLHHGGLAVAQRMATHSIWRYPCCLTILGPFVNFGEYAMKSRREYRRAEKKSLDDKRSEVGVVGSGLIVTLGVIEGCETGGMKPDF